MGIIKQGVFGGFLGKVGNVIGATWRGITYIRIKPLSVSNPRTAAQLDQRGRFLTVIRFLRPFREVLRIGFKNHATRMTTMNAAVSNALKTAVAGVYPDFSVDVQNLQLTKGSLRNAPDAFASSLQVGTVQVEWSDQSGLSGVNGKDKAMVVVHCPALGDVTYFMEAANREDGIAIVAVPDLYAGLEVNVWLSFTELSGLISGGGDSSISDSVYAGPVVVA